MTARELASPRRDSGFITQPRSQRASVPPARPGACPPAGFAAGCIRPAHRPRPRRAAPGQGTHGQAPAPTIPEPQLRGDLRAGVPPAVTIWLISGRTSPPPLWRGQLLAGTLPQVPGGHGLHRQLVLPPDTRQVLPVPGENGAESKEKAPRGGGGTGRAEGEARQPPWGKMWPRRGTKPGCQQAGGRGRSPSTGLSPQGRGDAGGRSQSCGHPGDLAMQVP